MATHLEKKTLFEKKMIISISDYYIASMKKGGWVSGLATKTLRLSNGQTKTVAKLGDNLIT